VQQVLLDSYLVLDGGLYDFMVDVDDVFDELRDPLVVVQNELGHLEDGVVDLDGLLLLLPQQLNLVFVVVVELHVLEAVVAAEVALLDFVVHKLELH